MGQVMVNDADLDGVCLSLSCCGVLVVLQQI
jgi:hypothetical protein